MNVRRAAPLAGLLLAGLLIGAAAVVLFRDAHTAEPELLTGTVIWSNSESRMIAFEQDGVERDRLAGDTIYQLAGSGADLPECLLTTGDDKTRQDRRRVEVNAIHADYGGPQQVHVALNVRCLGPA
jgi:hypothetical protein